MNPRWYVLGILLLGGGVATAGQAFWPGAWGMREGLLIVVMATLTACALVFPLKLSPQASASLGAAPLFTGVLLLSPLQAVLAGAVGSLAANLWLRRRPQVVAFNAGMTAVAVGVASITFRVLAPSSAPDLMRPLSMGMGLLAGAVLYVTNLGVVAGMVSLRKGPPFWSVWRKTWVLDSLQEVGSLALGYLGAGLLQEAWWSVVLLLVPLALTYLALSRSVQEARTNIHLAQQLQAQMAELKATQAQLVQSAKMASVGTLAAGIAHEIANPLFAIQGRAELLLSAPEKHLASEKAKEYLATIFAMAQRASHIIRELLTFARAGGTPEPVYLPEVVKASLDLVGAEVRQRGIEVCTELGEVPPIRGVANHLQQVFVNLLLNARDATPEGGRILVRCWAEGGMVKASVKDTGKGIPKALQARLFEPFFTTKEPGKGTGLGLYICHRIVTEHGGRISVASEEGKGTEVFLEFPAEARETASLQQ
ncbi:Sensor kinase CckA [bacterium HR23]|nr:Sensor kinase CckA [bacterium HR23]